MNYIKKKREKFGPCNICGVPSQLTWDHVPPKSCFNDSTIKFNPFYEGMPRADRYADTYQSGIRFRSICSDCNNGLLGANYDLELKRLTLDVKTYMFSSIDLPPVLKYHCNVNKLARSICGHLLAADDQYVKNAYRSESLRGFVLDPASLPPANCSLLIRVYPHTAILLNKSFMVQNGLAGNSRVEFPSGMLDVVSSFPLAYIIADKGNSCGLVDVFSYCSKSINECTYLPIDFNSCCYPNYKQRVFRDFMWPCNVGDDERSADFMLLSDNSSIIGNRDIPVRT